MIPTQIPTDDAVTTLCEVGRRFYTRGWALGTSGNFSAVLSRDPFELAITASAVAKGDLRPSHILHCNDQGRSVCDTPGTPSAEALLHIAIARRRHADAVLHTHSVWSTLVSDAGAAAGGVAIEGYEMLKGLAGVRTHEHREWIPILDNDQDMTRLARRVVETLGEHPEAHAFLLRRHGLYTWGETLADAERHVEILEFLLEAVGRSAAIGGAPWRY
jgi:methylthioribulose-1-phosphate dehydratase